MKAEGKDLKDESANGSFEELGAMPIEISHSKGVAQESCEKKSQVVPSKKTSQIPIGNDSGFKEKERESQKPEKYNIPRLKHEVEERHSYLRRNNPTTNKSIDPFSQNPLIITAMF